MTSSSVNPSRLSVHEKLVLAHVGVLLLVSTWAFGGNIDWARKALCVWASGSVPLAAVAFVNKSASRADLRRRAWWLLPPALYAGLVIASAFNPSFLPVTMDGEQVLLHRGPAHPKLPSTISAAASLDSLWFGAGAYLSAFNLALVIRSRAALRGLLILIAANALALSIFGTLQKLASAGFYFGAAVSPNPRFFATFIYYNHWGAFMVVALSLALGLLFYHTRRLEGRDLWHSPFTAWLLGVLLIAATAPISGSRAATGMAAALACAATVHALVRIVSRRRREKRSALPPVALLCALVIAASVAIGWLGYRSMSERYVETRLVLEKDQSLWSSRVELYRDTWTLAAQKPVFGWGLNTYGAAFQLIRPMAIHVHGRFAGGYDTAHNDWLQSLAETGFAGTALLLLTCALPLAAIPRRQLRHPLVAYPLAGVGVVLLYAWIEFPFSSGAVLFTFWTVVFATTQLASLTDSATRPRND